MNKKTGSKNFRRQMMLKEKGYCPFCENKINIDKFKDELSIKEYKISGLCQSCQDKFFDGD